MGVSICPRSRLLINGRTSDESVLTRVRGLTDSTSLLAD
jgi:hypothetical protein